MSSAHDGGGTGLSLVVPCPRLLPNAIDAEVFGKHGM